MIRRHGKQVGQFRLTYLYNIVTTCDLLCPQQRWFCQACLLNSQSRATSRRLHPTSLATRVLEHLALVYPWLNSQILSKSHICRYSPVVIALRNVYFHIHSTIRFLVYSLSFQPRFSSNHHAKVGYRRQNCTKCVRLLWLAHLI